jgi:hypothetical protein
MVVAWVVAAIAIIGVGSSLAGEYNADYDTPGSESKAASDLTEERVGGYSRRSTSSGRIRLRGPRAGRKWLTPPRMLSPLRLRRLLTSTVEADRRRQSPGRNARRCHGRGCCLVVYV